MENPEALIEKYRELINFTLDKENPDLSKSQLKKLYPFAEKSNFYRPERFSQLEKNKIIHEDQTLIALTDSRGVLVYANDDFLDAAAMVRTTLLEADADFKIIRHPDMPKSVYLDLWATITTGQLWSGIICNQSQDGFSYWHSTNIFPIIKDGIITHFMAVYKPAPEHLINEAILLYRKLP